MSSQLIDTRSQEPDRLLEASRESLAQAVEYCFGCQEKDGHWTAECSADATFTSQYVMFKYCIQGLSLDEDGERIQKWLLSDQTEEGSWVLAPHQGLPGNISTTIESYLALRILGTPKEHPQMIKARDFVQRAGGIEKARFFTRFFLATFGIVPWEAIPEMPAELILLPNWAPINIYVLSSWSRSTLIPILVVRHHQPVYALPNGQSPRNDFIDELWANPANKYIPYAPSVGESLFGKDRNIIEAGFTMLDNMLVKLGGLRRGALRQLALRRCIEWLLEHQEESGDWAGFFPPIHGSVWALLLEGFPLDDQRVRMGMEALERLAVDDHRGKWIQATVSPCWDTGLCVSALADAGIAKDPRVEQAVEWLKIRQLTHDYGDWRIYCNTQVAGGWSFEYFNTFYPDVDDSAVVVMALAKQDPSCIDTPMITNCMEWIIGMQNFNGGWGAFDCNNEAVWLHNCPFSDMDSFVDPASADITGRMLECYGVLMSNRKGRSVNPDLKRKLHESAVKAIAYLDREQESFGAWWGRWGNNYNYGTTNCLRGLAYFASTYPDAKRIAQKAVQWLEDCQNDDGGWGESLLSYTHKHLAGNGPSTAAQTAWALDSLLRFRPASSPTLRAGAQWLIDNQVVIPENGRGASWGISKYVGTGFPHVLYLGYPFYHHFFPVQALARFVKSTEEEKARNHEALQLSKKITADVNKQSVLMISLGSREDLEPFLTMANKLEDSRVRIATHRAHESAVVDAGFEFFDIGGTPEEMKSILENDPKGTLVHSQRVLRNIYTRCWDAGLVEPMRSQNGTGNLLSGDGRPFVFPISLDTRPFVADVVVSAPTTTVHVHLAEMVQVPLVLVSNTESVPSKEVQRALSLAENSLKSQGWSNALSYFTYDMQTWLNMGPFFNNLRSKVTGMHSLDLVWATRDFAQAKIPHFALYSSPKEEGTSMAAAEIQKQAALYSNTESCSVLSQLPAYWKHNETGVTLSGAAAAGLVFRELIAWDDLDLVERYNWTAKWRQAGSSGWLLPLHLLYLLIVLVSELFVSGFNWLCGVKGNSFPVEDHLTMSRRAPIRRARMRQAHFDFETVEREASDKEVLAAVMEQRWKAARMEAQAELFAHNTDPGRSQMIESKFAVRKEAESRADSVLANSDAEQSDDEKAH